MTRFIGIDFGERRIGLAVSDPLGMIAMPLRTIGIHSADEAVPAVVAACRTLDPPPAEVVVGMPLHMSGQAGVMAARVEEFVRALRQALAIPVHTWDERMSSGLVERVLLDADLSRGRRRQVRDKLAAQVILQGYLDVHTAPAPAVPDEDDGDA